MLHERSDDAAPTDFTCSPPSSENGGAGRRDRFAADEAPGPSNAQSISTADRLDGTTGASTDTLDPA